jgi:antitoxin VapB
MTTAKLFTNGGSQAVRLPAEFKFQDAKEVFIRRDEVTREIVLSEKLFESDWNSFFAFRDAGSLRDDLLQDRPLNERLIPTSSLEV